METTRKPPFPTKNPSKRQVSLPCAPPNSPLLTAFVAERPRSSYCPADQEQSAFSAQLLVERNNWHGSPSRLLGVHAQDDWSTRTRFAAVILGVTILFSMVMGVAYFLHNQASGRTQGEDELVNVPRRTANATPANVTVEIAYLQSLDPDSQTEEGSSTDDFHATFSSDAALA